MSESTGVETPGGEEHRVRRIARPGCEVAYEVFGAPAERTVVLLHNVMTHRGIYDPVVAALRQQHFRTVAVDFRGHGDSGVPEQKYEVGDLCDDVLAVLEAEAVARFSLVGDSIGATVAMELALRRPSQVDALMVMGATALAEPAPRQIPISLMCSFIAAFGVIAPLAKFFVSRLFGESFRRDQPLECASWQARIEAMPATSAAWVMRAWGRRRALASVLGALGMPCLVVVGDEDTSCPLADGESVHRAIAGSRLVRVPAAGHSMPAERPQAIIALLQSFLDSSRTTTATAVAAKA